MGYTKDGSDARAEEKELHSFSHWVLKRLHMIRDKEGNKPRGTNVTLKASVLTFPPEPEQMENGSRQ